jgi:hypothetical protein
VSEIPQAPSIRVFRQVLNIGEDRLHDIRSAIDTERIEGVRVLAAHALCCALVAPAEVRAVFAAADQRLTERDLSDLRECAEGGLPKATAGVLRLRVRPLQFDTRPERSRSVLYMAYKLPALVNERQSVLRAIERQYGLPSPSPDWYPEEKAGVVVAQGHPAKLARVRQLIYAEKLLPMLVKLRSPKVEEVGRT